MVLRMPLGAVTSMRIMAGVVVVVVMEMSGSEVRLKDVMVGGYPILLW
jgi:hypothetical protein